MTIKTDIKVISLEASTERRANFTSNAKDASVKWSFYPANSGVSPTIKYSPREAVRRFGRALSGGEIGCHTSHFKVWEEFLKSDQDQLIVFEDDVCVDWLAIEYLAKLDLGAMGINLLRLHATNRFKAKTITSHFKGLKIELLRGVGLVLSSAAYVLTRQAAQTLVARKAMIMPLDWELGAYWEHGLTSFILFPFPVFTRQLPSTIGSRDNYTYKMSITDKLLRRLWQVRDKILKLKAELTNDFEVHLEEK